jgi:DNA-binding Lrp family transcriptional regulator
LLHLDDLDIKIIRELGSPSSPQWNVRESYSNISRRLGVDEETVRIRVRRAKERGFLPAWRVMVNPRLLGCGAAGLDLEVDDEERKPKVTAQIRLVDGVTNIADFRGRGLLVTLYYENDESLERKVKLIESICGAPRLAVWKSIYPKPEVKMMKVDWRIVGAMREDAMKDLEDVSRPLGVSTRTVQRRLTAMKEGRAIYLSGAPNPDAVGGLMCNFLVFCADPGKKRAADKVIHSTFARIGASDTSPEHHSTFGMSCENLSQADKVLAGLRSIDGVSSARMRLMENLMVVQDWLKYEIDKRISD